MCLWRKETPYCAIERERRWRRWAISRRNSSWPPILGETRPPTTLQCSSLPSLPLLLLLFHMAKKPPSRGWVTRCKQQQSYCLYYYRTVCMYVSQPMPAASAFLGTTGMCVPSNWDLPLGPELGFEKPARKKEEERKRQRRLPRGTKAKEEERQLWAKRQNSPSEAGKAKIPEAEARSLVLHAALPQPWLICAWLYVRTRMCLETESVAHDRTKQR